MAEKKKIRIECEGVAKVPLDDLTPLQGDLKALSEISYQKLRSSIIDLGFSFPVHAWKVKGKIYILDAHQRISVLKRMRDEEGYEVPQLPVSWVHAASRKEAARKLLAAAAQYGEVTQNGLSDFMKEFQLDITQAMANYTFPEFDMEEFQQSYFPETVDVSFKAKQGSKEFADKEWAGMPEFQQSDKTSFRHLIVHFETQEDAEKFFKLIGYNDTGATKSIWFPDQERMDTESKRYG